VELVLKKGVVETSEIKTIFSLKDKELERILYVLVRSGLVNLDQSARYLSPTAAARIFLHEGEDRERDEIQSDG
jgi:transcription initiation factor IIE alpha subunit